MTSARSCTIASRQRSSSTPSSRLLGCGTSNTGVSPLPGHRSTARRACTPNATMAWVSEVSARLSKRLRQATCSGCDSTLSPWLACDGISAYENALSSRYERVSRSEEHTSELQSLMRISYAVFCLKKNKEAHKDMKHTRR